MGPDHTPTGWYIGKPSIGWQLRRVIRLPEPIPCAGQQGLWKVPADLVERIRAQLAQLKESSR